MNNSCEQKAGGASIKPSARPSIHSHRGACAFRSGESVIREMGRFGLDTPKTEESTSKDQGIDEVDNVISKLARAPTPIAARRSVTKRNSFDVSSNFSSDEDFSANHSKSLPSSFLTHSNYSDAILNNSAGSSRNVILENKHNEGQEKGHDWLAENLGNTPKNLNRAFQDEIRNRGSPKQSPHASSSQRSTYIPEVVNYVNRNPAMQYGYRRDNSSNQGSQCTKLLGVLSSIAIATMITLFVGDYLPINKLSGSTANQYSSEKFYRDLNYIGEKHNIRDDSILQLQTAITTIVKNQDSGSFVLVYNSKSENFDEDDFDALVNFIASTAAKFLRNDSTSVQHIVVDGSKFEVRSHSELLSKYREDVTKSGVMLVREVDEVPSDLAMAFHYYCDEFNPVVKKSAIFFTLDMTKCYTNSVEQKATHGQIEKCLRRKWSGVPQDNISPLLNRVVNTIVDVAGT